MTGSFSGGLVGKGRTERCQHGFPATQRRREGGVGSSDSGRLQPQIYQYPAYLYPAAKSEVTTVRLLRLAIVRSSEALLHSAGDGRVA
jgi:hypothetical protein